MSNEVSEESVFYIAGKQEVFQALVSGMHISLSHGKLYRYLHEFPDQYREEFTTLGYNLIHEQDYYYLEQQDETKVSVFSRKCLVFISIILESIANNGTDVVDSFYSQQGYDRDQLPHFTLERYRNYMQYVDIQDEKQLNTLLKNMHRSGFVKYNESENNIQFLSPCHRFLQLALDVLQSYENKEAEDKK